MCSYGVKWKSCKNGMNITGRKPKKYHLRFWRRLNGIPSEYSPFDVYVRAMAAYFQSHEVSVGEWERTQSVMYPVLSQYQKEGYHRLMEIARRYRGALLCDGVGLGKTFIGLDGD